jgi:hypothetical protein
VVKATQLCSPSSLNQRPPEATLQAAWFPAVIDGLLQTLLNT